MVAAVMFAFKWTSAGEARFLDDVSFGDSIAVATWTLPSIEVAVSFEPSGELKHAIYASLER
jgi:hypothetical protein